MDWITIGLWVGGFIVGFGAGGLWQVYLYGKTKQLWRDLVQWERQTSSDNIDEVLKVLPESAGAARFVLLTWQKSYEPCVAKQEPVEDREG